MTSDVIGKRIEDFIATHTQEKDNIKIETMRYGIKVFLINACKIPIIFTVAYAIGILKYSIISYICFGTLRTFAGGIHAEKGMFCIISSMIAIFSPVYLSRYLNNSHSLIIFLITFIIIIFYSPSDTKKKPIKSHKLKQELRTKSIIVVVAIFIISNYLPENISNMMITSIFIESLLVLPITYKIFRKEGGYHV